MTGRRDKLVNDDVEHLRKELQESTWESRKALAWVCIALAAAICLVALQVKYPVWTLLFLVPLGIFLAWNWGDWRSGRRRVQDIKARLRALDKQVNRPES